MVEVRQGQAAFRIQGPWMSGDAIKDLGAENVGVARVPPIPGAGDPRHGLMVAARRARGDE